MRAFDGGVPLAKIFEHAPPMGQVPRQLRKREKARLRDFQRGRLEFARVALHAVNRHMVPPMIRPIKKEADQAQFFSLKPAFLAQLARRRLFKGFAPAHTATGQMPPGCICHADQQDAPVVHDHSAAPERHRRVDQAQPTRHLKVNFKEKAHLKFVQELQRGLNCG